MRDNNVFGFSFYAKYIDQLNPDYINLFGKVEANIFNRIDLEKQNWELVWKNVKKATSLFGGENTSFHFPVNESNILQDNFISEKLIETLQRAEQLNIPNVVLHSNQLYLLNEWEKIDLNDLTNKYLDSLEKIIIKANSQTKVCLENMPPIGNLYDDADPLFLFIEDFEKINIKNLYFTWDICHYFNTVSTMKYAENREKFKKILPNYLNCEYMDFTKISKKIKHWHFSGFDKIANPYTNSICKEGVLPWESVIPEEYYASAFEFIYKDAIAQNKPIIFEISEQNYHGNRKNLSRMLEWGKKISGNNIQYEC